MPTLRLFSRIALIVALGFVGGLRGWAQPVPVIFDTDLGPDSDDAGALAMLHTLETEGEAVLLGVVCSTKSPWCAPAADVINTYFGRPDVPIGTLKGPGPAGTSAEWFGGSFNGYLAGRFENDLQHGEYAADAVRLYRALLSEAEDASVAVVVVGGLTNLRDLLRSPADSISELDGETLVRLKVRELTVMGGRYPSGSESNFNVDPEATRAVVNEWPTPTMFSGYELGDDVLSGPALWETRDENPVRQAYHLWDLHFARRFTPEFDPQAGIWPHSSFDQTAVLYAVRGLRPYWDARTDGRNIVHADGSNSWQDSPDMEHSYLLEKAPRDSVAAVIERLMMGD